MIGRVGQVQGQSLESLQKRSVSKNEPTVSNKDAFIPSDRKVALWRYSAQEIGTKQSKAFGDIPEPDWRSFPTKGGRTLTDEQILVQMKELAEREVNASAEELVAIQRKKEFLSVQYISDVSPDRKMLYKIAESKQQTKAEEPKLPLFFTLVDVLCELDKAALEEAKREKRLDEKKGSVTAGDQPNELEINIGSQCVMRTLNGEWTYVLTPLEQAKQQEFEQMYEQAKAEAGNRLQF